MAADRDAWDYFQQANIEIYAEQSEFDGTCGIMAYNKTSQSIGRANQINDMEEWIVAVGKHKPIISGADWVKVQNMLGQNKSKSYRQATEQCCVAVRSAVLRKLRGLYASQAIQASQQGRRTDLQLSLPDQGKKQNADMRQ